MTEQANDDRALAKPGGVEGVMVRVERKGRLLNRGMRTVTKEDRGQNGRFFKLIMIYSLRYIRAGWTRNYQLVSL